MIKLSLPWPGTDYAPDTGVVSEPDDSVLLVVEYDGNDVHVYASTVVGAETYVAYMALEAWCLDEYGAANVDIANELASRAVDA